MRTVRVTFGPFIERPYFELREIEDTCLAELRGADLYPGSPGPIRIERFVEKRFKVSPRYEDLPGGVLGFTKFGKEGVKEIVVAASLDEEGSRPAERRIRTTLAHEAGHGLFHAHLIYLAENKPPSLFNEERESGPEVLCRDIPISGTEKRTYDGRWWEYQANRAMGALLLPRPLLEEAIAPFTSPKGSLGNVVLEGNQKGEAIRALAEVFDVNPVVARIRIEDIFSPKNERQLGL